MPLKTSKVGAKKSSKGLENLLICRIPRKSQLSVRRVATKISRKFRRPRKCRYKNPRGRAAATRKRNIKIHITTIKLNDTGVECFKCLIGWLQFLKTYINSTLGFVVTAANA